MAKFDDPDSSFIEGPGRYLISALKRPVETAYNRVAVTKPEQHAFLSAFRIRVIQSGRV